MDHAPVRASGQQQSERELRHAILETVYCHLVCFIAVWLILFAPLYCEYHGLMLNMGDMHMQPDDSTSAGPQPGANILIFHQMASSVMMAMSFLVAAAPHRLLLLMPTDRRWMSFPSEPNLLEPLLPVPEQPPRLP